VDDAYRAEIVAGFNAVAKSLAREMEAAHEVIGHDKDFGKLVGYQQNRIRVSLEDAYEIKRLLYELRDSLDRFHDPEGEFRIRTSVFMAPSLETSREAMKKAKKK
ncbi:MAG TPA: hypothetical protein VK171_15585, partial [Fimbriimonas sp.]|nr:hypothetical protein [Fimbriimonas sp.]